MWKRLSIDISAGSANNSTKIIGVNSAETLVAVTSEDLVRIAISNSNDVKNAFNTQLSVAISTDGAVQNSFNTQVSTAISTIPAVQNALSTSINNINNSPGTTITYQNPPTVNGQPLLALPTSRNDGDHLMYDGLGTTNVSAKKLLIKASAAERTQLVNFGQDSSQQRTAASFQRILDEFYRFSYGTIPNSRIGLGGHTHYEFTAVPGNPRLNNGSSTYGNHMGGDAYTWQYNNSNGGLTTATVASEEGDWDLNANNEITQGINTNFWIGFASPPDEAYDSYDATIVLKSTGSDDDHIGFVLALNRGNPDDPNAQGPIDSYIAVYRTLTNQSDRGLKLVYDFALPTGATLAQSEVQFGFVDDWSNGGGGPGWAGYNGTPLKIERRPDRIRIWAIDDVGTCPEWDSADWGNTPVFDLDLTADSRLTQFQNPGNWGLLASSQAACSWGDLMFNGVAEGVSLFPQPDPAVNNMVFDVESGITYIWSNGDWVQDPQGRTIHDYVDSGQMLLDTSSGSLYVKDNGELQLLQSTRMQGLELTDDYEVSVNDIGKLIVACPGCNTLTFDGNYGLGWHCTILNKSGSTLSLASDGDTKFGDRDSDDPDTTITIQDGDGCIARGNGHNDGGNLHTNIQDGRYGTVP